MLRELSIGAGVVYASSIYARGDENNQDLNGRGENSFTGSGRTFAPAVGIDPAVEQFRAVGAPRGGWVTLEYRFGDTGPSKSDAHDS